jgi:hypothetical protein
MRSSVRIALAGSAVLAGVAFASPAFAAVSTYPQHAASGTNTSTVAAGHSAHFAAGGFKPGSSVTVTVSDGRSFSLVAGGGGAVAENISFASAGTYTITASGVDAGGHARTVSSTVTVSGALVASAATTSNTGGLPFTGMEVGAVAALGAATLLGGATVRVVARRRGAQTV